MRYLNIIIALSVFQAYTSVAATATAPASTIVCESCPTTTAASQFVTRTAAPTPSCSAPALTVVFNASNPSSASSTSTKPTTVPFTGAGNRVAGSMGGALAIALAAAYVL